MVLVMVTLQLSHLKKGSPRKAHLPLQILGRLCDVLLKKKKIEV